MAVSTAQRVGIWIIAIAMLLGTIVSFVVMIFANDNARNDQARAQQIEERYTEEFNEYQLKVVQQAQELSERYFETFSIHKNRVKSFNPDDVTELKTHDIVVGDGEVLTNESTFTAYYIGWNSEGVIFDSSLDGESLKSPFAVSPGGVITGWTEGVVGMKVGGIRQLDIPADKAYGEMGQGEHIAPNAPIKFVVMVIPTPEPISPPEAPQELINYYNRGLL
jgi:FKBP-type peptidyl-prolyl cis-trans isomerase